MLELIVPHLLLIPNYACIKAAAKSGYKHVVKYALQYLDPMYLQKEIPDDILIETAKQGHLAVLTLLIETRKGYVPLEAYQKAFARGHVSIVRHIQKLFPFYTPESKNIIEACTFGHHEVIQLLPETVFIPNKCFSRAAQGKNPELIEILHEKKPQYVFKPRILNLAIQSNHCQVFLTVFYCGKFNEKPLPPGAEIELINRHMREALSTLHSIGYKVYTEESILAASRVCDLPILKDILEVGQVEPSEKTVQNALNLIYVSSETLKCRAETYTYLDHRFKHLVKNVQHQKRRTHMALTTSSTASSREDDGADRDNVVTTKRLKHIHH
jgi:hypothetical protein